MSRILSSAAFILSYVAALSLVAGDRAAALDWDIEAVDGPDDIGWFASIALDAAGEPAISYCAVSTDDLRYAIRAAGVWRIETVDTTGRTGWYTSLALDPLDTPHIAYWDLSISALRYAHWNGSAWDKQTVDNAAYVGQCASLALDRAGRPSISYYDYTNGDLKYARWDGSVWRIEAIDDGAPLLGAGLYTSLVLDGADLPHISYADHTHGQLRYARTDGSSWVLEVVDGGTPIGTSLELDGGGVPHISYAYQFGQGSHLKYAVRNGTGGTWTTQIVRPGGQVGLYSSLKLTAEGDPRILSWDLGRMIVDYDAWTGTAWSRDDVEAMGWTDQWCSLALDSYGRPHAAYRSSTDADLHYGFGTDPAGASALSLPRPLAPEVVVAPNPVRAGSMALVRMGPARRLQATIHDASGRRLLSLWDGPCSCDEMRLSLPAMRGPGVRFLRVTADARTAAARIVLTE